MKKESIMYMKELNRYLSGNTHIMFPMKDLIQSINTLLIPPKKYTDNKEKDEEEPIHNKQDLAKAYKELYINCYQGFQYSNLKFIYDGLTDEQIIDMKANNVFIFNSVMNNIFKNVVLKEINEKQGKENYLEFLPYEYAFGGMSEGELYSIDEDLSSTKALGFWKEFERKNNINANTANYDELAAVFSKTTDAVRDSESLEEAKLNVKKFALSFHMMRNHFNERSFLSKYFTPSGIKEWWTLEHAHETLVMAIPDKYIDDISFTIEKDGNITHSTLDDLDNKTIKDVLDVHSGEIIYDEKDDLITSRTADALKEFIKSSLSELTFEQKITDKDAYIKILSDDNMLIKELNEKNFNQINEMPITYEANHLIVKTDEGPMKVTIDQAAHIELNEDVYKNESLQYVTSIDYIEKLTNIDEKINDFATKNVEIEINTTKANEELHYELQDNIVNEETYDSYSKEEKEAYNNKIDSIKNAAYIKKAVISSNRVQIEMDLDSYSSDNEILSKNDLFDELEDSNDLEFKEDIQKLN